VLTGSSHMSPTRERAPDLGVPRRGTNAGEGNVIWAADRGRRGEPRRRAQPQLGGDLRGATRAMHAANREGEAMLVSGFEAVESELVRPRKSQHRPAGRFSTRAERRHARADLIGRARSLRSAHAAARRAIAVSSDLAVSSVWRSSHHDAARCSRMARAPCKRVPERRDAWGGGAHRQINFLHGRVGMRGRSTGRVEATGAPSRRPRRS
jgi:hypothetical protein